MPLTVAQMMTTHVKTMFADESISLADWEMALGEMRHLPVIDRERRVVGMLSDRDLSRAREKAVPIVSVMTREVKTIRADATAADAADLLLEYKRGALPVVDAEDRLVGIVTSTDFIELARRALSGLDIHKPHVRA